MKFFALVTGAVVLTCISGCVTTGTPLAEILSPLDMSRVHAEAWLVLGYVEGESAAFPPVLTARAEQVGGGAQNVADIAQAMCARHAALLKLKQMGILGEDNRAYIELRSNEALTDETTNEVQKLVHAENTDRKNLYKEVARIENRSDVTLTLIERVYAMARIGRAQSGVLIQLPSGADDLARIRAMDLGRRLGDACQPEAWVAVP